MLSWTGCSSAPKTTRIKIPWPVKTERLLQLEKQAPPELKREIIKHEIDWQTWAEKMEAQP